MPVMNEPRNTNLISQCSLLCIGPLRYQFRAYDEWGCDVLTRLSVHLPFQESFYTLDRIIHLVQIPSSKFTEADQLKLPDLLVALLPEDVATRGWQRHCSGLDTVWFSSQTIHTFWNADTDPAIGAVRFHFPWGLVIEDIVVRGGGLIHGGLASHQDSGLLFLAPPGGGKSTMLSTAPPEWRVLSDDAALIWPDSRGGWLASPLPAWGNMINTEETWRYYDLALGSQIQLNGLFLLEKAMEIHLQSIPSVDLLPGLYRALCEYPAAVIGGGQRWGPLFRMAAQMVRDLPAWRLRLPRCGDIWPLLCRATA
jgi:hypothetical protein